MNQTKDCRLFIFLLSFLTICACGSKVEDRNAIGNEDMENEEVEISMETMPPLNQIYAAMALGEIVAKSETPYSLENALKWEEEVGTIMDTYNLSLSSFDKIIDILEAGNQLDMNRAEYYRQILMQYRHLACIRAILQEREDYSSISEEWIKLYSDVTKRFSERWLTAHHYSSSPMELAVIIRVNLSCVADVYQMEYYDLHDEHSWSSEKIPVPELLFPENPSDTLNMRYCTWLNARRAYERTLPEHQRERFGRNTSHLAEALVNFIRPSILVDK